MPPVPAATPDLSLSVPPSAPPVARPGRRPGPPRVMVIGDSVSWTLGAYWPGDPRFSLSNQGVQGCGIAVLPDIRYAGGLHTNYPYCATWESRWGGSAAREDPDVTVVLLDRWELMDRKLDGRWTHVGEPAYDAYLTGQLNRAVTLAAGHGARVALLTAPYTRRAERPDGGLWPEDDTRARRRLEPASRRGGGRPSEPSCGAGPQPCPVPWWRVHLDRERRPGAQRRPAHHAPRGKPGRRTLAGARTAAPRNDVVRRADSVGLSTAECVASSVSGEHIRNPVRRPAAAHQIVRSARTPAPSQPRCRRPHASASATRCHEPVPGRVVARPAGHPPAGQGRAARSRPVDACGRHRRCPPLSAANRSAVQTPVSAGRSGR